MVLARAQALQRLKGEDINVDKKDDKKEGDKKRKRASGSSGKSSNQRSRTSKAGEKQLKAKTSTVSIKRNKRLILFLD